MTARTTLRLAAAAMAAVLTVGSASVWEAVMHNPKGSAWFPYNSAALFSMSAAFFTVWLATSATRLPARVLPVKLTMRTSMCRVSARPTVPPRRRATKLWRMSAPASISSTSGSAVCAAAKACRPKRASTPASSADAIAIGMRFMMRSNQPVTPNSVISAAHTMNAPVACAMSKPPAMPAVTRHIGLSLGADICWPLAFEQILADAKLELKVGKDVVKFACERTTLEPYMLQQGCKYDLVVDRLTHWFALQREWIKTQKSLRRFIQVASDEKRSDLALSAEAFAAVDPAAAAALDALKAAEDAKASAKAG